MLNMVTYRWAEDEIPDVERILRALSVTGKLLGFRYAVYMIEQAVQNPECISLITKCLYPDTAKHFHTSPASVERAVRTMIKVIWQRTDHALLEQIAGTSLSKTPSNSEFIDMVAGFLRRFQ